MEFHAFTDLEGPFRLVIRVNGPARCQAGDQHGRLVRAGEIPMHKRVIKREAHEALAFTTLIGLAGRVRNIRGGHADPQRALGKSRGGQGCYGGGKGRQGRQGGQRATHEISP